MTAASTGPRVLLINAPFGLIEFPHLGTSLIKAATRAAGFDCDVLYASIEFARIIGFTEYLTIERAACPMLLPERPFAGLVSAHIPSLEDYYRDLVTPFGEHLWPFIHAEAPQQIGRDSMRRIAVCAAEFTESLVARTPLAPYDVVAFSSSYGQHLASLAIAKRISEVHPGKIIAFGGANCEGAMGKQLVKSFPFVDYAFSGDGDVSFPLFLQALRDGRPVRIPGVFSRATLAEDDADLSAPLTRQDLNQLPYPDYTDYFAALERAPEGRRYAMGIPIEGSRGCWWGEKHHCTFCGLNGLSMRHRAKTAERFQAELRHLVERYGHKGVMAADNILDRGYFRELLPLLKKERFHDVLFFEIKANLRRDEVEALADAGITHVQPGIESLSTHVLGLMDKGTTALQNVQLLKWAEEYGITLTWNLLCGFPGETGEDYEEMGRLMQKIPHLQPPAAFARISIDRFSPYFDRPRQYGIEVHPSLAYSYVYDLPAEDIRNLAYWHYYSCDNGSSRLSLDPPAYARHALRLRAIWERAYGKVWLRYSIDEEGCVHVDDGRPGTAAALTRLDPLDSAVFLAADAAVPREAIHRRLLDCEGGSRLTPAAIDAALHGLEERRFLHRDSDSFLALATTAHCRPRPPALGELDVFTP